MLPSPRPLLHPPLSSRAQRQRFALFDAEARRLLGKRLPVPAYDHLLKLSHAFNILDARGAVGVTERADCFATMRGLAREVTGATSGCPRARVPARPQGGMHACMHAGQTPCMHAHARMPACTCFMCVQVRMGAAALPCRLGGRATAVAMPALTSKPLRPVARAARRAGLPAGPCLRGARAALAAACATRECGAARLCAGGRQ